MSHYNINSIIPISKINDLSEAYHSFSSLDLNQTALKNSYNKFISLIQSKLCANKDTDEMPSVVYECKTVSQSGINEVKVEFSFTKQNHFNINLMKNDFNRQFCEEFVRSVLMQIIKNNKRGTYRLCLIDAKNAGASFGNLISIINSDHKNFFGKVFMNDQDINVAFNTIESVISDNIAKTSLSEKSVFEYNKENADRAIPITFFVIFDCDMLSNTLGNRLANIEQNAEKGGVNIIKISSEKSQSNKSFDILINNAFSTISKGDFEAKVKTVVTPYSTQDIEESSKKEEINTNLNSHINIDGAKFTLDSTDVLSIPFAIDEYGNVESFEIGGYAPPHALISGATGSGKSVLLHTIIDSVIFHYHPNDVEIWAIDYKAVEFACYAEHRTPHITVVGQDKSEDFSYSLLDLINKEYERRKKLFVKLGVTTFKACRAKGEPISRLLIVVDEFHNLTQAVQQNPDYKILLENLLSEMRAMGMSFIFCSQTISSGLNGLTDKGKNQIGNRLCMKQTSVDEIKVTLADTTSTTAEHVQNIINFSRGQVLYKKNELSGYNYKYLNVLFIDDNTRKYLIDSVNNVLGDNYIKRHEVICKNSERFNITEKKEHTLNKYLRGNNIEECDDGIAFYPAAPTTLEEEFMINFERAPSNNMILCIEDDSLRESIEVFCILSLLADENNSVSVSIFDTENSDCVRLNSTLSKINSPRLNIYLGAEKSFDHLYSLKKLKPLFGRNQIEFFYGVNKIKNALYILSQSTDDTNGNNVPVKDSTHTPHTKIDLNASREDKLKAILALSSRLTEESEMFTSNVQRVPEKEPAQKEEYSFEETLHIMNSLFEYGPDMGYFSFMCINNVKQLKQIGINRFTHFEYRIGGKMSGDDSYTLFSTENFTTKADEKTVVLYTGSPKKVKTLRPYLLPDDEYLTKFNKRTS